MLSGMEHREIKTLTGTFSDNRRHFDNFRARADDDEDHVTIRESGITICLLFFIALLKFRFLLFVFLYGVSALIISEITRSKEAGTYIHKR